MQVEDECRCSSENLSRLHDFSRLGSLDIFIADFVVVVGGWILREKSEINRLEVGPVGWRGESAHIREKDDMLKYHCLCKP